MSAERHPFQARRRPEGTLHLVPSEPITPVSSQKKSLPDIMDLGACADMNKSLFEKPPFLENPQERNDRVTLAIATCHTCPVQEACFDDAMNRGLTSGIRGGADMEAARDYDPNETNESLLPLQRAIKSLAILEEAKALRPKLHLVRTEEN